MYFLVGLRGVFFFIIIIFGLKCFFPHIFPFVRVSYAPTGVQ